MSPSVTIPSDAGTSYAFVKAPVGQSAIRKGHYVVLFRAVRKKRSCWRVRSCAGCASAHSGATFHHGDQTRFPLPRIGGGSGTASPAAADRYRITPPPDTGSGSASRAAHDRRECRCGQGYRNAREHREPESAFVWRDVTCGRNGPRGSQGTNDTRRAGRKISILHNGASPAARRQGMICLTQIEASSPGSLILVLGPTGVGKTTLRRKVEESLTAKLMPAMEEDPGRLPVLSIEAVAPDNGNFHWRDHFHRMLAQMREIR